MASMRRAVGLGAALAVTTALAACGGSSGPSKADFVRRADTLCQQTNVAHPAKPAPRNAKEALAQATDEIAIRTELDRKLRALAVPSDSKQDFDAYNAGTRTIIDALTREKADAQAGDQRRYATDQLSFNRATAAREAVAKRLGFNICSRTKTGGTTLPRLSTG
jgi:hypothetical protein